jgi:PAS domain S-box-containing protein
MTTGPSFSARPSGEPGMRMGAEQNREALRAREDRFATFIRHSRDGIIIIDSQGTILEWNEGEERISGIPRSQAVTRPIWELQHRLAPDEHKTAEFLRTAREKALKGLEEGVDLRRTLEEEIQCPDGTRRTVQAILFGFRSGADLLVGAICRDVTERKHLEEDLRERQALLLEAERLAHLGHWARNLRSGRSSWSDEIYRILGHAPGSFIPGREAFLEAVAPEDRERIAETLSATARDGVTRRAEFQVVTRQGSVRCLDAIVEILRDAGGIPARIIGTVQDITERKQAEEALRQSQGDLRHAQAVAHVGSWRINVHGSVLEWSEETYRMFGIAPETPMTYERFLAAVHPEDRQPVDDAWQAALRGQPYDIEHRIVLGEDIKWVREVAHLEFDRNGALAGGFGTVQDITDRKMMEQALADANRRKDEFLAILSHELRNPLAPLRNSLHVLARTEPGGEQARRMHAIIERQVAHLTRLVDDLLDVTRISRGKIQLQRERVELGEIVRRTVEDHRSTFAANGIHIDGPTTSKPMWLTADPTRIAQVVGNILTNAAKFTPRGGRVDVALEQEGQHAVLRVLDTGVGIPRDMLDRLFEPFMQADQSLDRARGGLGLGLSVARDLAELHGGSVTATSEGTGRGAEFTVRLPLEERTEKTVAAEEARPARSRRVLIIEDDTDAAVSLKGVLELDGHEVQLASNGPEGLAKARTFQPEVVLCDIGLPGMDGYEVARACRGDDALRALFLVALTGYALPDDLQRAQQAGFQRHLAKPPSFEELEALLAQAPALPAPRA